MKVLLLGSSGQLGHDIRRAHEDEGSAIELIPLSREQLDVATPGEIERVLGELKFDALINCTSYHRTDEAESNADLAFTVNAHAVQAIARACAARRARFIHISTDYVFGGDTARTRPLREADPIAPVNVYGASKAMGETLACIACEDTLILRVASLFGIAGASGKGGNFVETIIRVGLERGTLRVVDDQVMSPTATADVARIVLRMIRDGCAPGYYHVVNSGAASWFDFACEIVRRARLIANVTPCVSAEYPTRAMRPRYSALDNTKVATSLGTMPQWQDALERYLYNKGHMRGVRSAQCGGGP